MKVKDEIVLRIPYPIVTILGVLIFGYISYAVISPWIALYQARIMADVKVVQTQAEVAAQSLRSQCPK